MNEKNKYLIGALVLIAVGVIGFLFLPYFATYVSETVSPDEIDVSLGERIFFNGQGEQGRQIPFSLGPRWLYMRGGGCVSCHGEDGKGGIPIMMSDEIPPSITWKDLTTATEDHEEEEGEFHEEEHEPYTEETLKTAIVEGINPAGKKLDSIMPRWNMTETELEAIVRYLKTL